MDTVYRTIDANLNRAREGLRVIEEIVRMTLDHPVWAKRLKALRGELLRAAQKIPMETLLAKRDTANDVGAASYSREEKKRRNVADIFAANFKRTQEALRVLEEFIKLLDHAAPRASLPGARSLNTNGKVSHE